ncbi:putative membrane protein [Candidatus Protofrankia californiensis]|uniref:Putative membrane protein n=1 Tax=Candidatus Protofrankia californiensis TaxID=1839754 RepID=A0A1C3NTL5_9ACTN|nr:putative membrane protein [Candidatus Protofrankia californiensis]
MNVLINLGALVLFLTVTGVGAAAALALLPGSRRKGNRR